MRTRPERTTLNTNLEQSVHAKQTAEIEPMRLPQKSEPALSIRLLIPVCAACGMVRDEAGEWHEPEPTLCVAPEAEHTHGLCPACVKRLYPDHRRI